MESYIKEKFTGERALFQATDISIKDSIFEDGESPLKEGRNISVSNSEFKWKYPFWYSCNIFLEDSILDKNARAAIWYTYNIKVKDTVIEAPKSFRRCEGIELFNVQIPDASETLWDCKNISMKNVKAKGEYFAKGCTNLEIDGFEIVGNYAFDGAKNLVMGNGKMETKDAFWNCENITVYDSYISGEYFGWNSKNVTLINCTVDSLQGMCYMENLVMKNCRLKNTNLAFEYSTIDVEVEGNIHSIKNPYSGKIKADHIGEIIFDNREMKKENTEIITIN